METVCENYFRTFQAYKSKLNINIDMKAEKSCPEETKTRSRQMKNKPRRVAYKPEHIEKIKLTY